MKYLNEFDLFVNEADNTTQAGPNQKIFIDKLRGDKPVLVFQYTTEDEKNAILLWMTRSGFKEKIKSKGVDILIIKADRRTFHVGEDPKNTTVLYNKGTKLKEFFGVHLLRQSQYKWDSLANEVEEALRDKPSPAKWLKSNKTSIVFLYDNIADRPLFSKFIEAYKSMMKKKYSYFTPTVDFVAVNLKNTQEIIANKEEREAQGLESLRDEQGKLVVTSLPSVALFCKLPWEEHAMYRTTVELSKRLLSPELEKKAYKLVSNYVSAM